MRTTGQERAPGVTIALTRDTATKLYKLMGSRPHDEAWSLEVWLQVRRACGEQQPSSKPVS